MERKMWDKRTKIPFITLVVSGFLAMLLLTSFGTGWGVAYGQTAGPTVTPIILIFESTPIPTTISNSPLTISEPIIPDLPQTGNAASVTESQSPETWKIGLLAFLVVMMAGSSGWLFLERKQ
jgi:hypothetical protein